MAAWCSALVELDAQEQRRTLECLHHPRLIFIILMSPDGVLNVTSLMIRLGVLVVPSRSSPKNFYELIVGSGVELLVWFIVHADDDLVGD